ncbi:PH domain-containing protein [Flexithrix dorotheae]|uniref:PH domain-containing protein n=1 Tax=Flexithrix dorotheae TaxID=70993 RepID=UPI00037A6CAB|nr:PH domain-containing protein [Flexithrix dorotheae]
MAFYKPKRKGFFNYLLVVFMILPFAVLFLDSAKFSSQPFLWVLLWSPFGLLLWIYLDTFYQILDDKLIYKSAFLKGEIEISSIREIIKGKTMWTGVRPAIATKGLIIKFNKYNEIYIAPENNDRLVEDLLKINEGIIVS